MTYVVAELSANHNGKLDHALRLIDAAAAAGANAVKLQTYTPDCLTIDHPSPAFKVQGGLWDGRKLYDLYSEGMTPWHWHDQLFRHARAQGLECFSSPFSVKAVDFLDVFDPPYYKIASFEITDLELIRAAAETGKPIIMSTGCATHEDITLAVNEALCKAQDITLLHCVSAYPADARSFNIQRLTELQEDFGCNVGLSDHSLSITLPVAAVALGASMVEKHITLSHECGSLDAKFSMEPHHFKMMVDAIRETEAAMKPANQPVMSDLKRSLYVVQDIRPGQLFTNENVRAIRPGHGLHPCKLPQLIGKSAKFSIARGTPFSMDMVV